jgi:hypothetical protein
MENRGFEPLASAVRLPWKPHKLLPVLPFDPGYKGSRYEFGTG